MNARDVGEIFAKVAALLEMSGENQFRVRAYESASRLLLSQTMDLELLLGEVRDGKIKGIGAGLKQAIEELAAQGKYSLLEELEESISSGMIELLAISGLGPKKIRLLRSELGVETVESLITACEQGRLIELRGFSEKSQAQILESALRLVANRQKLLLPDAVHESELLVEQLSTSGMPGAVVCGEIRRSLPVISAIDILGGANGAAGDNSHRLVSGSGVPVSVHVAGPNEKAAALLFLTGSASHLELLQQRASQRGLELREEGLFRGGSAVLAQSEAELYRELGLSFIPAELREGGDEVAAAGRLFERGDAFDLLEDKQLRGLLHVHSTYSDGVHSIRELAEALSGRGFSYLGISDHSQSAAYAGGLKAAAIERQRKEILALNEELAPFRIFHGIESDILADGSLDYPEDILKGFDFVIASVHSRFSQNREAMTARLVAAVRNPYTAILGHPSGRKLLERPPYEADVEAVLKAAAESGTAVEINANPRRLDLAWEFLPLARELGIQIPVSPDAHSIKGFDDVHWGVQMARKGGLSRSSVLNCKTAVEFEEWCRQRKKNSGQRSVT